ncbi:MULTISPECIES: toxin-antitoxin system TumE family protein [Haloferax]|uniref:Uncharacterized protein n=1 Tax=Haloferax volcanii TaxID=2246 RepID=A0A558G4V3_HALVO|nr:MULTISPECIES: DUF6516 family protein [Haloferax]TVT92789.1 hypothetical protein FQA18_16995 [Haloferax volcanii]
MPPSDEVEVLYQDTREFDNKIIHIRILSVPKSEKFPEGVKYGLHYGRKGGDDPIVRYDNHHGVHERHEGDTVEEIPFPGVETLLRRFQDEVETHR